MEQTDLLRLDRDSVTVWPCLREEKLGDWILRFGGGVYGRSNSVQPFGSPACELQEAIEGCEARYRAEGIRPMYRIPDVLGAHDLDASLDARGYELSEPTAILIGSAVGFDRDDLVSMDEDFSPAWFRSYLAGSGRGEGREAAVDALMRRVQSPRRFARIEAGGEIVSNGLGVIHNGVLWLFGIATVPGFRRQGMAARLVRSLIAWGAEEGAGQVALQVSKANTPAVQLYLGMGLTHAYGYHYRRL